MKYLNSLLLFSLFILSITKAVAASQPLDRIVAVVNDNVITQGQLNKQMELARQQAQASGAEPLAESELRHKTLEQMINMDLQLQIAKKMGLKVSDQEVTGAITSIAQRNGVSLEQLQEKIKQSGINYESYRQQIRDQITISQIQERNAGTKVVMTEQEVNDLARKLRNQTPAPQQNLNAQYRVEDLLVPLSDKPSTQEVVEAEQKAKTLLAMARAGTHFQTIVQTTLPANSVITGDLGLRPLHALPELFVKVVQNMQPGAVSNPFRAPNGFHIVKLVEVRGAEQTPAASHLGMSTHARHILIRITPLANDAQIRARLLEISADLARGGDFTKLAQQYSQDPGSAGKGGDLGWAESGMFAPEFETAMNKLKPGQTSEPVKTKFGWHLIQVLERKSSKNDQAHLQNQARQMIYQRKMQEASQKWMQQLRKQSYVKILD